MSFDFDAAVLAPHRMQPGLRRLAPGAAQLTPAVVPNRGVARHLREKLAVLWAFPDQALLCAPGFDARPALAALAAHAAAEHPQAFVVDGARWAAPWLGWALAADAQIQQIGSDWPEIGSLLRNLPAEWRHAALLSLAFAEDFALLDGATGTLPWLAVALPSMWAPERKVGRHFSEVHGPVADAERILAAAPQLMQLVTGERAPVAPASASTGEPDAATPRWERFVWTLSAHPRLHAHPQRVDPAGWAYALDCAGGDPRSGTSRDKPSHPSSDDALAAQTWWRTERQTFIPLPARPDSTAQAIFTILVELTPLRQTFASPAQAGRVHDALASMSEAVLAYRGLTPVRAPLLRWLARQATAPGTAPP